MTDLIKQEKIEHIERLKMELEELENLKPEPEPHILKMSQMMMMQL